MSHPEISHNEKEMVSKSRNLLNSGEIDDPVLALRHLCLARGFSGFLGFGRCFHESGPYGGTNLTRDQFYEALYNSGFELPQGQTEELYDRFYQEKEGGFNIAKLLATVRPEMSNSRKSIVNAAFSKMDKDDVGVITMDVLKHFYSVNCNPRYVSGVQSQEVILKKFIDHFEENNHVDAEITKDDFDNYYAALSASVDDDTYFDLVIRQVYKL